MKYVLKKNDVISSTDTTVTMLSKYNLHVGNSVDEEWIVIPLANPTGKQNSKALGYFSGYSTENPIVGTIAFSDENYWSTTVSSYPAYVYDSNSTPYIYVENYKTYLSTLGVTPSEARLITYEEFTSLGCSGSSCENAPSWVYATSYWSGSASSSSGVWCVDSNGLLGAGIYSYRNFFGCRPVITISRNYL